MITAQKGDRVIAVTQRTKREPHLRPVVVQNVTELHIRCDVSLYDKQDGRRTRGYGAGAIRMPNPGELEEWDRKQAAEKQEREEREAAQRAREATDEYKIARRCDYIVVEQWERLGMDKLRQIAAWLDEINAA